MEQTTQRAALKESTVEDLLQAYRNMPKEQRGTYIPWLIEQLLIKHVSSPVRETSYTVDKYEFLEPLIDQVKSEVVFTYATRRKT